MISQWNIEKIQEALEALQKGRLVLVIDDKDRENEET